MSTAQLDLSIVLPKVDAADECVDILTTRLIQQRGIEKAHIVSKDGNARLCLHYDPNLASLSTVQRLANDAGAEINQRYRHEQIPFKRPHTADAAPGLEKELKSLKGMIHASVSYATGVIFVAYDSQILTHDSIEGAVRGMGISVTKTPSPLEKSDGHNHANDKKGEHKHGEEGYKHEEGESGHDHGSAPAFLPHWMQERWTLILVGLAAVFFLTGWLGERFLGFTPELTNVFYTLAYIAGGYDVATHAIPALLKGKLDTDILMLAAAAGAAALGELSEGAFLLLLFSIGHAGEHYALDRARNAISALGALMPKTAQVKRGDQIVEEPVEGLQVGDVVIARPGDRIPVDGKVANGSSAVDQSPITGESVPVTKSPGDEVFAGTVNKDNALDISVTRVAADNTLSRVMKLVP